MNRFMFSTVIALSLLGCDGGKDTGDGTPRTATIEGTSNRSSGESGAATIVVFHVGADGSLEEDAGDGATAGEDGNYSVDFDLAAETESNLVVMATYSDGSSASALISGEVSEGEVRIAPPMDEETSAEADIFVQLVVSGDLSAGSEDSALIRAFLDASTAAAYEGASDSEQELVATATLASAASWSAMTASSAELDVAMSAYADALVEDDADADAASSGGGSESVDAMATLLASWESSGYSDADIAYAMHAAAEASLHVSGGESGDALSSSVGFMAETRAELMANVVSESWSDLGISDSTDADEAGASLSAAVDALVSLNTDILNSSWDTAEGAYATSILAGLTLSLDVTQAASLTLAEAAAVSAQAELSSAIDGANPNGAMASGEAVATAMADYRATIDADVGASLTGSGAFDQAEAQALVEILGQIHANAQ